MIVLYEVVSRKIKIIHCHDKVDTSKEALKILLRDVDKDTLLLLSGGTSPDLLYRFIVQNKTLRPGAVALVDERFGLYMHDNSNEKMIFETGLLDYFTKAGIRFYNILGEREMEEPALKYEQIIRGLFEKFPKKVAIMGVGADAHTAGIKPNLKYNHTGLVVSYDDAEGPFGKRITLTFEALAKIGEFIILVLGENKKRALEKMFQEKNRKEFPVVFYNEVPAKIFLITDIEI